MKIPGLEKVEAERARRSLRLYLERIWPIIEPGKPFVPGYHIDAICDHLQAVTRNEIRNLIINIPPRMSKSTTVSVGWPTWSWLDCPESRWLTSSYALQLAVRDAVKSRRVIQHELYKSVLRLCKDPFQLSEDQNLKGRYENDHMGHRIASSVIGANTGEGGDYIVVDDPHNVLKAESEEVRKGVCTWWDEVMSTRINDANTGHKVIIAQRSHYADLCGHALETGDYEHLNLPQEYEGKCVVEVPHLCSQDEGTSIGYTDWRTEQGELLCPARMNQEQVEMLERSMGAYAYAGQQQQRPTPREGGMFDVDKFIIEDTVPDGVDWNNVWRAWDKAGTEGGAGARTAGVKMAPLKMPNDPIPHYIVLDVEVGRYNTTDRENKIKEIAWRDGRRVRISVEQEPGSGGLESAEATVKMLDGFSVHRDKVTGSKEVRAEPYATRVGVGVVHLLKAGWNKEFIEEHRRFPLGVKDCVDAAAQAYQHILDGDVPLQIFA